MTSESLQSPQHAESRFQWNVGGWFGAQLGGSVWMLIAALVLMSEDPGTGAVILGVCLATNLIGLWIWSRRRRYPPYPCIQVLVGMQGAAALFSVAFVDRAGLWERLQYGGRVSVSAMYVLLGILIPGLMLLFHTLNRAGTRSQP